jgi:hypothetical protein
MFRSSIIVLFLRPQTRWRPHRHLLLLQMLQLVLLQATRLQQLLLLLVVVEVSMPMHPMLLSIMLLVSS